MRTIEIHKEPQMKELHSVSKSLELACRNRLARSMSSRFILALAWSLSGGQLLRVSRRVFVSVCISLSVERVSSSSVVLGALANQRLASASSAQQVPIHTKRQLNGHFQLVHFHPYETCGCDLSHFARLFSSRFVRPILSTSSRGSLCESRV